jgi:hypothetical protein
MLKRDTAGNPAWRAKGAQRHLHQPPDEKMSSHKRGYIALSIPRRTLQITTDVAVRCAGLLPARETIKSGD